MKPELILKENEKNDTIKAKPRKIEILTIPTLENINKRNSAIISKSRIMKKNKEEECLSPLEKSKEENTEREYETKEQCDDSKQCVSNKTEYTGLGKFYISLDCRISD